ncbi:MAG: hypothetical protein LW822_10900 [Phycisphaeraceae bacterium]|nr:hypothetical protein [Phycisphaeraceae bacterium]
MHMAWVRQVCGRLKSDFRYSNKLVYNNFPWPQDATAKQQAAVTAAAEAVLATREALGTPTLRVGSSALGTSTLRVESSASPHAERGGTQRGGTQKAQTLADLYDPLAMPKALRDAHKDLDRAVDKCYRAAPFTSERQRVEYLFDLYQKLITPLTAPAKPKPRTRTKPRQP